MITTRELATHIYNRIIEVAEKKKNSNCESISDVNEISYIQNLIELHYEPDNHLGSKGFISISKDQDTRTEYGC
jgi:hypothetical protein